MSLLKVRWGGAARSVRLVVAVAVVAVVGLALAPTSQAHDTRAYHPDGSWVAVLHDRHHWIAVCDNQADSHQTYGRYELLYDSSSWKPNYRLTGYDNYGNDGSGNFCHWEGHWSVFRDIAVCVQSEGCSGWVTVFRNG